MYGCVYIATVWSCVESLPEYPYQPGDEVADQGSFASGLRAGPGQQEQVFALDEALKVADQAAG